MTSGVVFVVIHYFFAEIFQFNLYIFSIFHRARAFARATEEPRCSRPLLAAQQAVTPARMPDGPDGPAPPPPDARRTWPWRFFFLRSAFIIHFWRLAFLCCISILSINRSMCPRRPRVSWVSAVPGRKRRSFWVRADRAKLLHALIFYCKLD